MAALGGHREREPPQTGDDKGRNPPPAHVTTRRPVFAARTKKNFCRSPRMHKRKRSDRLPNTSDSIDRSIVGVLPWRTGYHESRAWGGATSKTFLHVPWPKREFLSSFLSELVLFRCANLSWWRCEGGPDRWTASEGWDPSRKLRLSKGLLAGELCWVPGPPALNPSIASPSSGDGKAPALHEPADCVAPVLLRAPNV